MRRKNPLTRRRVFGSKEYKSTGRMFVTALMVAAEDAGYTAGLGIKGSYPKIKKAYSRADRVAQRFENWLAKHGLL